MAESSGAEGSRNKRLNFEENEDRISDLPDELIHHILSFLPSTKQAIQTGILSKRWKNQWACVPVLSFDCSGMSSDEDFARSIDNTLLHYDCCKIKKFHLAYNFQNDTNFSSKIRFATRNHVEELILDCCCPDMSFPYSLPEFLFENDSLVKLEMNYCSFECDWTKHWESCLAFNPLAEGPYVIASKSLKILVLVDVDIEDGIDIEIYCPSLEEFSVKGQSDGFACFPRKTIQNVVSGSPLLRLLEVENYYSKQLVIASTSLKRLVLGEIVEESKIELSCPNLEELNLYGYFATLTLTDFPSLICAILDFEIGSFDEYRGENVAKQMLEELDHVKELTMGSWFIEILSDVEMEGLSYSWLNNEALTLNGPNFEYLPGIVCALRSSPILERLVIKLEVYECIADFQDLNDAIENYWNSDGTVFNGLAAHLKFVTIIGLSRQDANYNLVLGFVEFLLKNARVLQKLVVMIAEDRGTDFAIMVSQKVSSFPRCSQHAIVELLYSE